MKNTKFGHGGPPPPGPPDGPGGGGGGDGDPRVPNYGGIGGPMVPRGSAVKLTILDKFSSEGKISASEWVCTMRRWLIASNVPQV